MDLDFEGGEKILRIPSPPPPKKKIRKKKNPGAKEGHVYGYFCNVCKSHAEMYGFLGTGQPDHVKPSSSTPPPHFKMK